MIPPRPNTEVTKVVRAGKMDKYGQLARSTIYINTPCRFVRKPKAVVDGTGLKVTINATAEFSGNVEIEATDQIELSMAREPTYTVFSKEDRLSVTGVVTGSILNLVKEAQ